VDTVRFPNGETGTLELVRHPGASAVIPFLDPPSDPDPRIVLIHQYRYAGGGYLFEVPAGIPRSAEESWEDCALRELEEETGYQAGELGYLGRTFTTPGFTDEVIHLFAAGRLEKRDAHTDPDEFLEVVVLRLSDVLDRIEAGGIEDGKSLVALLLAARFRESLWSRDRRAPRR
jgi:ADP-ribose pyrophosphatase